MKKEQVVSFVLLIEIICIHIFMCDLCRWILFVHNHFKFDINTKQIYIYIIFQERRSKCLQRTQCYYDSHSDVW